MPLDPPLTWASVWGPAAALGPPVRRLRIAGLARLGDAAYTPPPRRRGILSLSHLRMHSAIPPPSVLRDNSVGAFGEH